MTGFRRYIVAGYTAVCLVAAGWAQAGTLKCPPDSVKVGNVCIDTYEASVWQIPPSNTALVKLVQAGKATLAALTAGGATELGCIPGSQTPYPASFSVNGNWTAPVYAASVPGVLPSTCISWFQAEQACALSNKRLVTNQEWQRAAAGTPDDAASCNISNSVAPLPNATGSAPACVSKWGTFDMVGNVWELVGDWQEQATLQNDWPAGDFASDTSIVGGTGTGRPGEVFRGGYWKMGANAGIFAMDAAHDPSESGPAVGFRCAR